MPKAPPAIQGLKNEFVACRARRHRWIDIPDDGGGGGRQYREGKAIARLCARCDRCQMLKYEAWNRITAEIMHRTYRAPKGYSLAGNGVKPWELRKEYLTRLNS
jgi:hypothetical protein